MRGPTKSTIHQGPECKLHASKNRSQLGSNRIISLFFRLTFVWNRIAVIIFEYDLFGFGVSHFETHLILFNENPYVMLLYTSWFIRPLSNSLLQALYNWVKKTSKRPLITAHFRVSGIDLQHPVMLFLKWIHHWVKRTIYPRFNLSYFISSCYRDLPTSLRCVSHVVAPFVCGPKANLWQNWRRPKCHAWRKTGDIARNVVYGTYYMV